jgi:hypothetical protein
MRKGCLAFLVVWALVMPARMAAQAARATDPKDASMKLDVSLFRIYGEKNGVGHVTIKTYENWRARYLRNSMPTTLAVKFDDGDDGDQIEIGGNFRYKDGHLLFIVSDTSAANPHEEFPATHPNRHTVKAHFSLNYPAFKSDHLSAFAKSYEHFDSDFRKVDRAPDRGRLRIY